jgi:tetratricopeptide (TPR) repeat protein
VFLPTQEASESRNSVIPVYTKTVANQVADIESQYKNPDSQLSASKKLNELESAVEKLRELHQIASDEGNRKDIVTTTAKVQTVLLAGRLLDTEESAQEALEKYKRQQYEQAKNEFDSLVNELDDIRNRTPDQALDEYESELNTLQQACETNGERARKQDLGLETGLQPESVDVIRASLRGGQAQFESASSGDTDVFTPGQDGSGNSDTEVFDPNQASGETGDTEVFDPE